MHPQADSELPARDKLVVGVAIGSDAYSTSRFPFIRIVNLVRSRDDPLAAELCLTRNSFASNL